jgi:hypothetical protein
MANIGSEVYRVKMWQGKDEKLFENSIIRVLDLFHLTLSDPKNKGRLKEVARAKELFLDAVYNGAKEYKTTLDDLDKYFYQFALLVRMKKKLNKNSSQKYKNSFKKQYKNVPTFCTCLPSGRECENISFVYKTCF